MKLYLRKFKRNIKDLDKVLLFFSFVMFIFGLLNIVTASSREAVVRYDQSLYYYFYRQLFMLLAGLIASIIIISTNTKNYKKIAFFGFTILLFISTYLLLKGSITKGALNWIRILGFKFQPSEFAKPVIIVYLACIFEKYYKRLRSINKKRTNIIVAILFVGLFIPILVFLQKDLGTASIMIGIFIVMFLASPILKIDKFRTFVLLFIIGMFGFVILYIGKGYVLTPIQKGRLKYNAITLFHNNPCDYDNYISGGYQICNSFIALNTGGLNGLGIGNSKQKYSYIPEPHTDSVFAIISEEYGVLKSSFIFIAYIIILKRILNISASTNSIKGRFMCLGVATYIFLHIFLNIGGIIAFIPLTGVPLPFLSYGGSFAISLMASLAIVQRVHIEMKNEKIKV